MKKKKHFFFFFFFLKKAEQRCFHEEMDESQFPPWLGGNGYTLLPSSHRSQKAGYIIPQCYFLCCEMMPRLYCETMSTVDDTPFHLSLARGEQVAQ